MATTETQAYLQSKRQAIISAKERSKRRAKSAAREQRLMDGFEHVFGLTLLTGMATLALMGMIKLYEVISHAIAGM